MTGQNIIHAVVVSVVAKKRELLRAVTRSWTEREEEGGKERERERGRERERDDGESERERVYGERR